MASWRLKHPSTLAAIYALNGNALDGTGRYPGTLVNTPTWATFMKGPSCIELDGATQHVNIGDVAQLNAVSAFSICFWMNQDVIGVQDEIFYKFDDADNNIQIQTTPDPALLVRIENAGTGYGFMSPYTPEINAGTWAHFAVVYDGTQAGNTTRLLVYVDGAPVVLDGWSGTIPATTADLAGIDATIGATANSFDGKLYDFRIASCAYSRDEIISIIHENVPV